MRASLVTVGAALLLFALPGASSTTQAQPGPGTDQEVIVVLREGRRADQAVHGFERNLGFRAGLRYRHAFPGFAARVTRVQRAALERDPQVAYVADDRALTLAAQTVPVTVRRVGATGTEYSGIDGIDLAADRVDADIAIIDTGIQRDHPDLRVSGGYNCVDSDPSAWGDRHGHGTHVAGIAAAIDDATGVVGIAPGARLWSVRVFDRDGHGKLSWYACGVDWVAGQRDPSNGSRPLFEVANMSLRTYGRDDGDCGYTNADPLHTAICRAVAKEVTVVVAAGNDRGWASSWVPAAYDEVITVSAMADFDGRIGGDGDPVCYSWGGYDQDDTYADFSNYGKDVDLVAPGKCVLSTTRGGGYGYLSGTSMAAPAVAGAVALWASHHPGVSPAGMRRVLRAAATMRWAWWTDPDGTPDRLLDVSGFGGGPGVQLRLRSGSAAGPPFVGPAGGSVRFRVDLSREDGYAGPIDLSLRRGPTGARASFSPQRPVGLGEIGSTLTLSVPRLAAGLHEVTVGAAIPGGPTRTRAATFRVDATDPWVTRPRARLHGTVLTDSAVLVQLDWRAGDPLSGLRRLRLERSTDGGRWRDDGVLAGTRRGTLRWLPDGHRYRFRIRAEDAVGNTSAWSTASSFRLLRFEESAATRSAGWSVVTPGSASGDRRLTTTRFGPTVRLTTSARQLAFVSAVGPGRGDARVIVDGAARRVHLERGTYGARRIVDTRGWAIAAKRTIVIRALGTPGHPRVDVDAFIVLR